MVTDLDAMLERKARIHRLPEPAIRRALREMAGLTQAELAAVLGVDRAAVSRYETGDRSPKAGIAERYVDALERLASVR